MFVVAAAADAPSVHFCRLCACFSSCCSPSSRGCTAPADGAGTAGGAAVAASGSEEAGELMRAAQMDARKTSMNYDEFCSSLCSPSAMRQAVKERTTSVSRPGQTHPRTNWLHVCGCLTVRPCDDSRPPPLQKLTSSRQSCCAFVPVASLHRQSLEI
jgi:hypothetical protein